MLLFKLEGTSGSPAGTFIIILLGKQAIVYCVADAGLAIDVNGVIRSRQTESAVKNTSGFGNIVIESLNVAAVSQEFIADNSI